MDRRNKARQTPAGTDTRTPHTCKRHHNRLIRQALLPLPLCRSRIYRRRIRSRDTQPQRGRRLRHARNFRTPPLQIQRGFRPDAMRRRILHIIKRRIRHRHGNFLRIGPKTQESRRRRRAIHKRSPRSYRPHIHSPFRSKEPARHTERYETTLRQA